MPLTATLVTGAGLTNFGDYQDSGGAKLGLQIRLRLLIEGVES